MICPTCGTAMELHMDVDGGCMGHGPGEYCYCNSIDAKCYWSCHGHTSKWTRHTPPQERKTPCRQKNIPIYELGDQYAIARWLNENYPGDFLTKLKQAAKESE